MKITIPQSIADIQLHQYQKYDVLLKRTDLNEEQFNKRKIEIFTDLQRSRVELVSVKDYNEILSLIDIALNQTTEFIPTFFIKDVEFGFIPNLDKITIGEYRDLSIYSKEVSDMNKLMSVLFRPIKNKKGDKYTIFEYNGTEERADVMKYMPMNVVSGALVFFFEFSQRINSLYPEIYDGGTSEGRVASNHFEKWGWDATIFEMCKGKVWKLNSVLKTNIHEFHLFLAYKIDVS